jgi:uncharacterized membrane protein
MNPVALNILTDVTAFFSAASPKTRAFLLTEAVLCVFFLILAIVIRKRFVRLVCLSGIEVCAWLACKMIFGEDFILTTIMTWVTAALTLLITIAIVNRIDWGSLRGKREDEYSSDNTSHTDQ